MTCVSLYNIKQRSPLHHPKPDRLFPTSNSDRPIITHKNRSPTSKLKQRSPLSELFIIVVSNLFHVKGLSSGEIKLAII